MIVKLPKKHALDWFARCADEYDNCKIVSDTARTITLELTPEGLSDLISDTIYYIDEMGPDNTGDIDYRPAARRCLNAIHKAGIRYTIHNHSVILEG